MMRWGDREWYQRENRKAVIQEARQRLAELDAFLIETRLQRCTSPPRIVRKVKEDALVVRQPRLIYKVIDNTRYR